MMRDWAGITARQPFGQRRVSWYSLVFGFVTAALVFSIWPEIDLTVTRWFHRGPDGFAGAGWLTVRALYFATLWVGRALWVMALLVLLLAAISPQQWPRHRRRAAAMLVLCGALGCGLAIDIGLKNHWGRPRPSQLVEFGGTATFQPALRPSHFCKRNCSFTSGHAAAGFSLMALGTLGAARIRRRWWVAGAVCGGVVGLGRIAQGAHFLSDVVFSGLVIWGTCMLLRTLWLHAAVYRRSLARRGAQSAISERPWRIEA